MQRVPKLLKYPLKIVFSSVKRAHANYNQIQSNDQNPSSRNEDHCAREILYDKITFGIGQHEENQGITHVAEQDSQQILQVQTTLRDENAQ